MKENKELHYLLSLRMDKRDLKKTAAAKTLATDLGVPLRYIWFLLKGERGLTGTTLRLINHLLYLEAHGSLKLDDLASLNSH